MKTRTIMGAIAATALIGLGAYNFTQKNNTPQTKPETEVEALRKQYVADSLDFVNSDSVKAKAKLAELQRIQREYLIGKPANDALSEKEIKTLYETAIKNGTIEPISYDEFEQKLDSLLNIMNEQIVQYSRLMNLQNGGDQKIIHMENAISDAKRQIDIATGKVLKNTKIQLAQAELEEKQEKAEKERKDSLINEFNKVLAE